MVTINEAFSILEGITFSLKEEQVLLSNARNLVLAETLYSPINMPPFRQSNMDGFAICLHDSLEYSVIGEIKAGDSQIYSLIPGQAVKFLQVPQFLLQHKL